MLNDAKYTGRYIVLTGPARWENAGGEVIHAAAGIMCRLDSHRPEGWQAWLPETSEDFFLLHKYTENAILWESGREMMTRLSCGPEVTCGSCGEDLGYWDAKYYHIDAGGEVHILCPDCAAILLGESSRGIIWDRQDFAPPVAVANYFK